MYSLIEGPIDVAFVTGSITMGSDVLIPQGLLTAEWQTPEMGEMTTPNKQERAIQFAKWCREYEGIIVGEYPHTHLGIITVTVAGATFAYHTWEFPTVDLYVKIALAVNTGNLKKRAWDGRVNWFGNPIMKRDMLWVDRATT